jgi:RimJ/RimL family protein N-acetyltransferase
VDHLLSTERLVLRPVTADDHAALLAHWTQPDVRRFLFDGAALSAAEVAETIEESIGHFAARGFGIWLIELGTAAGPVGTAAGPVGTAAGPVGTAAGPVGTAGLRPLEESGLEIFYSLAPGAWGHGYATEAARAVVEYGLGPLALPEVLAEVDEGNAASVAVVKRLGMTPYAVVPGLLGPMTRYRTTAATT